VPAAFPLRSHCPLLLPPLLLPPLLLPPLTLPPDRHADNFSVEDKKSARELTKSCNLNLAATHLKLGAHAAAGKAADQVGAGAESAGRWVPGRSMCAAGGGAGA
jgi:hypothetical protein